MGQNRKVDEEKRSQPRDPGEQEQNKAAELGFADKSEVVPENPGKCQACGRDVAATA